MTQETTLTVKGYVPDADQLTEAVGLPRIKGGWCFLLCEDDAGKRYALAGCINDLMERTVLGTKMTCGEPLPLLANGWPNDWEDDEVTWFVHPMGEKWFDHWMGDYGQSGAWSDKPSELT